MAAFPNTFPCPQVSPFTMDISAGLVRTEFEGGLTRQRRRFKTMPHTMQLRWVLNQAQLGDVIPWLDVHGYNWFELSLPSELAGQKRQSHVPHDVRLIGDLSCNLIQYDAKDVSKCFWEVSATVEWLKYRFTVNPPPQGYWIIARHAGNPSPDWIIGQKPSFPSADIISAGRPEDPSIH